MAHSKQKRNDRTPEQKAALGGDGQEQEPKQAGKSDSIFDTDQHSDAPGPFGTGSKAV